MNQKYDIIILGAGPAGLSAALTAARGNRSILIFDDQKPRNAPAAHMMNFPSRDGTSPAVFRDQIRADLKKYPQVEFKETRVNSITRIKNGFSVDGIFAKKILLAHGVRDQLPPIKGMHELFGNAVFHCPYCHGYEYLDAPMGIIASGDFAQHFATLVSGLTSDLVIFTNGEPDPKMKGVKTYTQKIEALIHENERLTGVQLQNGEQIKRNYLFFRPAQTLSSDLGIQLGCELTEMGHYKVNELGLTSQPGIYAAGDIISPKQSVLFACASGSAAGAGMNFEILHEEASHLLSNLK